MVYKYEIYKVSTSEEDRGKAEGEEWALILI